MKKLLATVVGLLLVTLWITILVKIALNLGLGELWHSRAMWFIFGFWVGIVWMVITQFRKLTKP